MRKKLWLAAAVLSATVLAAYWLWPRGAETRWFKNQAYNYQTLRTLGEGVYGGSDPGEVLAAIREIGRAHV